MCSVDIDEGEQFIKVEESININHTCKKCNQEYSDIVLRQKDVYCRECFLAAYIHKFRSTIGKSKQIEHNDEVLVAVSGGKSSISMATLIKHGLEETTSKKIRFHPYFLHINESVISEIETKEFLLKEFERLKFPLYIANLEDYCNDSIKFNSNKLTVSNQTNNRIKLNDILLSCTSESSKEDLINHIRLKVICMCAKALNIQKVFVGDNSSVIAYKTLTLMSLGRGAQVSQLTHFKSECWGVQVFHPMKEISSEEINYYTDIQNITVLKEKSIKKASTIYSCTKLFIDSLSSDFPSTIPTICRTANKIAFNDSDNKLRITSCSLCGLVLDINQGQDSALNAKLLSKFISNCKSSNSSVEIGLTVDEMQNGINTLNIYPEKNSLCFGCQGMKFDRIR